ncbi:hypothetical protein ACFQ2B_28460 [Streptomyces stramineus]
MTGFRTLNPERTVQRTVFGDGTLTVTANFGTTAHEGLPGGASTRSCAATRNRAACARAR